MADQRSTLQGWQPPIGSLVWAQLYSPTQPSCESTIEERIAHGKPYLDRRVMRVETIIHDLDGRPGITRWTLREPRRTDPGGFSMADSDWCVLEPAYAEEANTMPIRPEMRDRYPDDWPEISWRVRFERAEGRCECAGQCGKLACHGRCRNEHGQPAHDTRKIVILTVAHLNHAPEDCRDENLLAMCQACHLRYDADEHRKNASHTRAEAAADGMTPLFDLEAAS